jgi:hypothetical protein
MMTRLQKELKYFGRCELSDTLSNEQHTPKDFMFIARKNNKQSIKEIIAYFEDKYNNEQQPRE